VSNLSAEVIMLKIASPRELQAELHRLLEQVKTNPNRAELAQEIRTLVARLDKTSNWWTTVLFRDEGKEFSVTVVGGNTPGGWSSLDYVLKEVDGRIKKAMDQTQSYLEGLGYRFRSIPRRVLGDDKKENYAGWHVYGLKPQGRDMETDLKASPVKAYIREGGM
jgi:hypothetical protein